MFKVSLMTNYAFGAAKPVTKPPETELVKFGLFPGFWGQGDHFWGQKSKNVSLEKIAPQKNSRKEKKVPQVKTRWLSNHSVVILCRSEYPKPK